MNPTVLQDEMPERIENLVRILANAYHEQVPYSSVEAVVRSCYAPFAEAKFAAFVPNLVEHESRDRLRQLAASGTPVAVPVNAPAGRGFGEAHGLGGRVGPRAWLAARGRH
jgi:hypothetical protein